MNFIALDFGDSPLDLINTTQESSLMARETVLSTETEKEGRVDFYASPESLRYFESRRSDIVYRTIAEFAAQYKLSITDNTGLTTKFRFSFTKYGDLKSDFWFTLFTDLGLQFLKPVKGQNSKRIGSYRVLSRYQNRKASGYSFEGESSASLYCYAPCRNIEPAVIDSKLKTLALNKWRAMQDNLGIASYEDAMPLDYITLDGITYIIVGKTTRSGSETLYRCVRETDDSYSFTGADIALDSPFLRYSSNNTSTNYSMSANTEYVTRNGVISGITFNAATDNCSKWDASTGQYTVPASGKYALLVKGRFLDSATYSDYGHVEVWVYKNGAKVKRIREIDRPLAAWPTQHYVGMHASLEIDAVVGDILKFSVYNRSGHTKYFWGVDASDGFVEGSAFDLTLYKISDAI